MVESSIWRGENVYGGSGDDVILGGDGNVFGDDGNDTLISHHRAVMTGGSGDDIFGFLATPSMQVELTAFNSEPVHSITDFETGSDSIRFYVSSELEQSGSVQTGNSDHITKTAEGDIEWVYFHAGQNIKTITVKMNDQSWSMDDIEFVAYTPTTRAGLSPEISFCLSKCTEKDVCLVLSGYARNSRALFNNSSVRSRAQLSSRFLSSNQRLTYSVILFLHCFFV